MANMSSIPRPQDGFIDAGSGGGIGWALVDDITHAEVKEEKIIDQRYYHTIKEVKNGEGPHPIKTPKGWLHLAHGVRGCAAGLRYVLYMYMIPSEDRETDCHPVGPFMVPEGEERIGDVSNDFSPTAGLPTKTEQYSSTTLLPTRGCMWLPLPLISWWTIA